MRNIITLFYFSVLIEFCVAQKPEHCKCEDSRLGKLIIKPLLKNGAVHYELAFKQGQKAKKGNDIVTIAKGESAFLTTVVRVHQFKKDSLINLKFEYDGTNESCHRLNGNGEIDEDRMVIEDKEKERMTLQGIEYLLKQLE